MSAPTAEAERLARLLEVGRTLVADLDLDRVLDRVLDTARALTGARYAAVGILDENRRELAQFLTQGIELELRDAIGPLPRGRGVLGVLIDEPRPLRLPDVTAHARSFGFPGGHPPMRTFLGVPLVVEGEVWGNLYLTEKAGGEQFDSDDERDLVVLAEWASVAIANARRYRDIEGQRSVLQRAVNGLEATMDIAQAIGGETDLAHVLELIAKRARALVGADSLIILLDEGDDLVVHVAVGRISAQTGARIPVAGSTSGAVLRSREARRVDDVATGLQVSAETLGVESAHAALLVPLIFRGRALGVLAAFDHLGATHTFDAEDERALRAFAASAATAVVTARSVEEQRLRDALAAAETERRRWALELHDQTLQGLGALKLGLSAALRAGGDGMASAVELGVAQIGSEIASLRAIMADLRPAALDELGLEPALRSLASRTAARTAMTIDVDLDIGERRLGPELETVTYRVAQEALTNVVKHARASHAVLRARRTAGEVVLEVLDDGSGFDQAARTGGSGLLGMRERATLAHGRLEIAPAPDGGTRVTLTLPVD